MKWARFAIESHAIPVKDAVGCVAVFLDLHDEAAGTDGVAAPAGDENGVGGAHRNPVQERLHRSSREPPLKIGASHSMLESCIQRGISRRIEQIPHLCLWLATKSCGNASRWVH